VHEAVVCYLKVIPDMVIVVTLNLLEYVLKVAVTLKRTFNQSSILIKSDNNTHNKV
jgi:hypothetical protein